MLILESINQTHDVCADVEHNFDPNSQEEEQECIVILNSDTVIYPGAVMIKSVDTLITDSTVSRTSGSYDFAFST